jgi:hypothetical protein
MVKILHRKNLGFPENTIKQCVLCNEDVCLEFRNDWERVEITHDGTLIPNSGGYLDFSIACSKCVNGNYNGIKDLRNALNAFGGNCEDDDY